MAAFVVSAAEQVSAGDEAAVEAEAVEASEAAVEEVAEAAEVVAVACPLLEMSYDELSVLTHALCDPLRPQLALQLSSVASGLRAPMQAQLLELRAQHEAALQLAALYTRQVRLALAHAVAEALAQALAQALAVTLALAWRCAHGRAGYRGVVRTCATRSSCYSASSTADRSPPRTGGRWATSRPGSASARWARSSSSRTVVTLSLTLTSTSTVTRTRTPTLTLTLTR